MLTRQLAMLKYHVFLVAICILTFTGYCKSQQGCELLAQRIADDGECDAEVNATCRDPCTGKAITSEMECINAVHCCYMEDNCILLKPSYVDMSSVQLSIDAVGEDFMDKYLNQESDPNEVNSRNLVLGGGFDLSSLCPTFPQTCNVQYITPEDIQPVINIPYCQRVQCNGDPNTEFNPRTCFSNAGCYFDNELHFYRQFFGQAILPGVPICHLAIRNEAFHRRVSEYLSKSSSSWNPLLTNCFLHEYEDEIFGGESGCKCLNIMRHFATSKRAGWQSITERECYLISGCWNSKEFACYYPVKNDDVTVKTGLPSHIDFYDTFGHPLCLPFSSDLEGGSFLDQYHKCLSAGCSTTIIKEELLNALYQVSSKELPLLLQHQYWTLALAGDIRADNWKVSAERLIGNQATPLNALNQLQAQGPIGSPISGPGFSIQAFAMDASDSNGLFPMFGTILNQLNATQSFSTASVAQLSFESLDAIGNFGGPASLQALLTAAQNAINPGRQFLFEPPCPYQNIYWPGIIPLSGNFENCCNKPKCYIDRTELRMPYSGVSSYITLWTTWSKCSVRCGGGIQTRSRTCVGKLDCSSVTTEQTQECNSKICPPWTNWSNWGGCSKTCRGGQRVRRRFCSRGTSCQGPAMERLSCNTNSCARFGKWSKWSRCNAQCGKGIQNRRRKCMSDQASCRGKTNESKNCESFCGRIRYQASGCNRDTCLSTRVPTCLKADGTEGHCRETNLKTITQKCYEGKCLCMHIPRANRCRTQRNG